MHRRKWVEAPPGGRMDHPLAGATNLRSRPAACRVMPDLTVTTHAAAGESLALAGEYKKSVGECREQSPLS